MRLKLFINLCFAFFVSASLLGQQSGIKGIIIDVSTNLPINTAFIFVNNTSYGTETNESGKFEIDCPDDISGELIISHINYAELAINFNSVKEIPDTIFMTPEAVVLDEVLVTENKGERRKEWIKKFNLSFLGNNDDDEIEILNPDDILFYESRDTFYAFASQPILIDNHELGYKMKFYLDDFNQTEERVIYSGKAFFEEVSSVDKKMIEKRDEIFLLSKRHFLRNLIHDGVDQKFFDCHESMIERSGDYDIINRYDIQNNVYRLYNSGYYALVTPQALYVHGFGKSKPREFSYSRRTLSDESSFLVPKSSVIIFNKDGVIINYDEVEEIGFWASQRIGSLLPFDYKPVESGSINQRDLDWVSLGYITNSIYSDDPISGKLRDNRFLINPVDLFMHLDREIFLPGENVWMAIYAKNNEGQLEGNFAAGVELINGNNEIEMFKVIPIENGVGQGSVNISESLSEGEYTIQYYLINNDSERSYSSQTIRVIKEVLPQNDANGVFISSKLDTLNVRFFPEGGSLVKDIESKVAIEVTDNDGNFVDFRGELIETISGNSQPITTFYNGMGHFDVIPGNSKSYQLKSNNPNHYLSYEFPDFRYSGAVLSVSSMSQDQMMIVVETDGKADSYRLLAHSNGVVFSDHIFSSSKEQFLFNKGLVPSGVLHFTLFNSNNQPLAERLVFNEYKINEASLKVNPSNSFYRKKSQVNLNIIPQLEIDKDSIANVSISVTDDNLYNADLHGTNILGEWLVNNRLDKVIPDVPSLIDDMGYKERFIMDLYLLTRGWRKFDWDKIDEHDNVLNQGVNISGQVEHEADHVKVVLSNLSRQFYFEEFEIKTDGRFSFGNVPVTSNGNYILQLKDLESDELLDENEGIINLDTLQPKKFLPRSVVKTKPVDSPQLLPLISNQKEKLVKDSLLDFTFNIDMEEVVIKEKRERDVRLYGLNDVSKLDWMDPNMPSSSMVGIMRPGAKLVRSSLSGYQFEIVDDQGITRRINAVIFIDGYRQWNMARFNSLTADRILYYGVNPPAIIIYTDPNGPRSLRDRKGSIYTYLLPGGEDVREFYKPVYNSGDVNPDFRTTIHWESGIKLRKGENHIVSFYSGDENADYTYIIQGMTSSGKPIYYEDKILIKD